MTQATKYDPKKDQNPLVSIDRQNTTMVALGKIDYNSGTQLRCNINPEIVDIYAEEMNNGSVFPPVKLFSCKDKYYVGDGFHRIEAAAQINRNVIEADIQPGGYSAALLYAAGANDTHGLRRTRDDKRKAIQVLLKDPKFCKKSDNQIAKIVHVSHNTVATVRKSLELSCQIDKMPTREFERNGKTSEMDIASKKENLIKKAVAEEAEKKRFYLFDYDERPMHISNPGRLKSSLHPDGFLLIVSHPGSLQKVFKKLNGHFEYLWTIAVAAEQDYSVDGMWVESKWRAITIWAKKIPLHLTFEDTLGLNGLDYPPNLGKYIKELRYTFDRTEDIDVSEDEIEDIEIEDCGIEITKGGEI